MTLFVTKLEKDSRFFASVGCNIWDQTIRVSNNYRERERSHEFTGPECLVLTKQSARDGQTKTTNSSKIHSNNNLELKGLCHSPREWNLKFGQISKITELRLIELKFYISLLIRFQPLFSSECLIKQRKRKLQLVIDTKKIFSLCKVSLTKEKERTALNIYSIFSNRVFETQIS